MSNVIKKVIKNWVEYDIYASGGAAGTGDVFWPASATNGHLAVFDWTTWKLIKDWWAVPTGTITGITMNWASKWTSWVVDLWTVITEHQDISWKANDNEVVKLTWNQTINWKKTFWTSPAVPSKTTSAANTWTAIATEAQVYKKQDKLTSGTNIKTVNWSSLLWSGNVSVWTLTAETVVSGDSWTTYTIKVSSSAPASWTASNIITIVTD